VTAKQNVRTHLSKVHNRCASGNNTPSTTVLRMFNTDFAWPKIMQIHNGTESVTVVDCQWQSAIFFHTTPAFIAFLRRVSSVYCHNVWYRKTRMLWLPDGEKVYGLYLLKSLPAVCSCRRFNAEWIAGFTKYLIICGNSYKNSKTFHEWGDTL